ncbi:MAG: hypothetical protein RBR15_01335 [Sphaerochaeta sp.]|nr:hypothetical protein [Sphaerochaeta sp.]
MAEWVSYYFPTVRMVWLSTKHCSITNHPRNTQGPCIVQKPFNAWTYNNHPLGGCIAENLIVSDSLLVTLDTVRGNTVGDLTPNYSGHSIKLEPVAHPF